MMECDKKWNALGRQALGGGRGTVLLLAYHNITTSDGANSWMSLDHRLFESHLRWLRRYTHLLDPRDLLAGRPLRRGWLNVMLTFDDGFTGWHDCVLPLLEKYGVHGLFFVSTDHLTTGRPFWFEEVVHILHHKRLVDIDLRPLGMEQYQLPAGGVARRWRQVSRILEEIKRLSAGDEDRFVRQVVETLLQQKQEQLVPPVVNRPLTPEQLQTMRRSGHCVFGSHAHNHRILTEVIEDDLIDEMTSSRHILQELLDTPVESIAYPNGSTDDRVAAAAQKAGYSLGFRADGGPLSASDGRYHLPRFMVGGFDGAFRLTRLVLRQVARGMLWQ